MQLNLHAANLDAAGKDYVELMRTYNIPHEDSKWANRMRRQHDQYFMQAPNFDFDLRELIFLYKNAIHRAQQHADSNAPSPKLAWGLHLAPQAQQLRFPDGSEDGLGDVSTDTHASTGANGNPPVRTSPPTNLVGERDLPEGSSDRPVPTNFVGQDNLQETPRPAAAAERSSASTPLRSSRPPSMATRQRPSYDSHSSSYGLFAHGDGLYTNATPMAWHHARTGNGQHYETFFYSSQRLSAHTDGDEVYRKSPLYLASLPAASAAPDAQAADLAAGTAGEGIRSRRWSPLRETWSRRAEDPATRAVDRERLQNDLRDAAPPRRNRYDDFPDSHGAMPPHLGPTPAAWTSQPSAPTNLVGPSAATVHHRPPPPIIDRGADFGRENASKFYQNAIATYQRAISTNAPPFVLTELPIQKFSEDIRTYPVFRNRFIETVEGRSDLEPRHKFQYLLQCLDEEPPRLASGYLIVDNNFFKILDRLEDRYGDKTTLVNPGPRYDESCRPDHE